MCLPSAVSIISENFSPGKLRNLAFSFIGGGQPIGFGLGMLMGGVCADTIGFLLSWWQLPQNKQNGINWALLFAIDWLGAIVISAGLALLSLALASVPSSTYSRPP